MAVKALVWIEGVIPHDDMTFTPRVTIKVAGQKPQVLDIVTKYDHDAQKSGINDAIVAWVKDFIQETWKVDFDEEADTIVVLNPLP